MKARMRFFRLILLLVAASGILTVLSSHADPPSCAPFNDPGCVFGENWENGTKTGWASNGGDQTNVTPGLNGTGRAMRLFWPSTDTGNWVDTGMNLPLASGQKAWWEWWTRYDINYRWACGDPTKQSATVANSSHKDFDILGAEYPGRILFETIDGTGADCHIANNGGTLGTPEMYFMADPQASPCCQAGHFFFHPNQGNFKLQPGNTYHFILEVTGGYKAVWNGTSPGGFKLWVNGVKWFDFSNVGTCINPSGACTWNGIRIGGQQAGVGPGGNIATYDQIRVTRTNIAPTGGTAAGEAAPPASPSTPSSPSNVTVR